MLGYHDHPSSGEEHLTAAARRPLRHCMIVDNGYPDIRVEREASALLARGHEVDVICVRSGNEPRREVIEGVTIYRGPIRRQRGMSLPRQMMEYASFTMWAAAKLIQLDARRRYDVVQAHNVPDFIILAALPAKLTGRPIVLDLHDLMPEFFASRFGGRMDGWRVRLVRLQERLSIGFADHAITVTDLWRDSLVERGFDRERIEVVMNTPDESVYARREPRVVQGDTVTLMHHGTITHRYGIDLLVRAVGLARDRTPLRLVLHGKGEMVPAIEDLIEELDLGDTIDFSNDRWSSAELAATIGSADIGVVPNRNDVFTDGILPTKLMEYVAIGVPAIVARSSAAQRYFSADMVRFVEPGDVEAMADAIVELARDPELRLRLARNAQAFTDEHPWRVEAERYTRLIEHLAASRGRGAPPS